tara:strand:- start:215 stop:1015 length:801 start_codon:yes stop_codon:yes gene_type:complete
MTKNFIASGCSFTFGHELSDDNRGQVPSRKSWAHRLYKNSTATGTYNCTAYPGSGNSGIARRAFKAVSETKDIHSVVIMWSFLSRYDWAMPRNKNLEQTRWASISPWDTEVGSTEAKQTIHGSHVQMEQFNARQNTFKESGVRDFAESLYRYAANEYHEIYISWKNIIWLQNILEKKNIPYMFTLADNTLFYQEFQPHHERDRLLSALYKEIDFTKWFSFGERMMGFNQWALLNDYERGVTHPLDKAHEDAVKLMMPKYKEIIGEI